jgi:hypothetical protein
MIPPIHNHSSSPVPHLNQHQRRICSHGIGEHPSALSPRANARASNTCWESFISIPKKIGNFFAHRFADIRMFISGFRNSGGTSSVVNQRFNEVNQLIQAINTCGADRTLVRDQFQRLSSGTRDLFYYLDGKYVNQFVSDPSRTDEIKAEMLRECNQVIFIQKLFSGRMVSPNTPITTIPGTVIYDRLAIPADVRQKADEINRLKIQYGILGLRVRNIYADPTTLEFMSIPVFDSSHPEVQTAMTNGDTSSLRDRSLRHLMDANTFDVAFATHFGRPPICLESNCVHSLQHDKLLIDTALQDEILDFLRDEVTRVAVTTTTTTTSTTTTTTSTTIGGFIEVPGTVRYVQNVIPADVQAKANEINRLKAIFDALRPTPAVPLIYNDPISMEILAIPVFDASHPGVQNALRSGESTRINNRDLRHILDKDSLEGQIRTLFPTPRCHICRHPNDYLGIRREHLRIDTALQDEILQFLRTATRTP